MPITTRKSIRGSNLIQKLSNLRNLTLFVTVLAITSSRLFWLPGSLFNQQNWDDEIGWIKDSSSRSPLEFIFYRDAPGYFVFIPRVVILFGQALPNLGSFSTLRILVIIIQLLCFAAAASCIVKWNKNWKFWTLIFISLSLTYIEDLNYVHNVGYLFIFPIILFTFSRLTLNLPLRRFQVFFSLLLICKPFTAILVLVLALLFLRFYRQSRIALLSLAFYSLLYLGAYVILPHRWDTPFNRNPDTFLKLALDFPWIVVSILSPALAIGAMGLLRVLQLPFVRDVFGVSIYLIFLAASWTTRYKFAAEFRRMSILTKGLISIFVVNYILVFSASDSFWVKFFPLFRLESPQFLWARWSSVIPLVAILIIANLNIFSTRTKSVVLLTISSQWFALSILGQTWLLRYW